MINALGKGNLWKISGVGRLDVITYWSIPYRSCNYTSNIQNSLDFTTLYKDNQDMYALMMKMQEQLKSLTRGRHYPYFHKLRKSIWFPSQHLHLNNMNVNYDLREYDNYMSVSHILSYCYILFIISIDAFLQHQWLVHLLPPMYMRIENTLLEPWTTMGCGSL